jgi:hypothetical protein
MNVEVIPLDTAPEAYHTFEGAPKKFVIDPHGVTGKLRAS